MATKDIKITEHSTSTPDGPKTYYTVKVVDKETGSLSSSKVTDDRKEAEKLYDEAVKNNPDATVNGAPPPSDPPLSSSPGPISPPPSKPTEPAAAAASDGMQDMKQADVDLPKNTSTFNERNKKFTANLKKKPVDCSGLPDPQRKICEESKEEKVKRGVSGVFGTKRMQAKVNRIDCESEKVITGPDNNAFIIIGNDRPGIKASGYGGKGHTQCDSIDLVVGLGGFAPEQADKDGVKTYTNPNFLLDSARIHISQKTDIDKNFKVGSEEGMQSKTKAKSAVALKADNIRLIARETLVLTTGQDSFNSQGGQIQQWSGIHLMANNDEEGLQPIPVGDNLSAALFEISKHLESLSKIFHGYLKYQMKFNQAVSKHTHMSPFYAKFTEPSLQCKVSGQLVDIEQMSKTELSVLKYLTNLAGFRNNYLTKKGKNYINSRFNKTN